ncbi:MAG: hypothetical protein JWO41_263 [Candidatus Saccharibacteria bacterium]|nr:hypothetical protein [Candidatus Saccharibacteria bacterium]
MKKLLIIGSPLELQESANPGIAEFAGRAINSGEVAISYCRIDQIVYVVDNQAARMINGVTGEDISENDLVWLRGRLASSVNDVANIANYLKDKGVESRNSFYSGRRAVGKIAQMYLLARNNLPIARTVVAPHEYVTEYVEKFLTYPLILKDCYGSHGEQNYLVRGREQLAQILADNPGVRFMAQQFIKGTGDYRILFAGSEHLIIHRRGSDDTHLNNTSQGAKASLIPDNEFPQQIVADARAFADLQEYEIAGVDAIIDDETGQHYFLEINSQPQVESGAFVPEKEQLLGSYFRNLLGL